MDLHKISVTILTKNSQKYLGEVLNALKDFDEVVLYDNGSTDHTFDVAKKFANVKIHCGPFKGFGPTHNLASGAARNEWILSIDSDEIVSQEMLRDLVKLPADPASVYAFQRHNFFNGKFIKWCGWYPDYQIRLYHRAKTRFSEDQVHESIVSQGMKIFRMQGPIIHYSYADIADFLTKMQSYSQLFAVQNCGKKKSSLSKAVLHGFFAFFKSYVMKRGFLGGYEGYLISAYNGHTAYYKYLKLYEANCRSQKDR